MNQLLLEISAGLNRLSVRSVLLKFASLKTVQVFQDAAERYDDFVESLRMSLNEELLEAISSQAPSSH